MRRVIVHCSLHTTIRVSISRKNLSVWIISKSPQYTSAQASGCYESRTWGALDKAWLGYVIAKNKGEFDKQVHYASIIQKLEKLT